MADQVTLLDFWSSPFGMRVRIALASKGVDYEYKHEDFTNKSSLLLQMNRVHKKIPVLIHNGRPICESLIIVHYIDEVWPDKTPLLPTDLMREPTLDFGLTSLARRWSFYPFTVICHGMWDYGTRIWTKKGEEQEAAKKDYIEVLKLLEEELGEKPFFGGDSLGYVDVALLPFTAWFYTDETAGGFSVEEECSKLMRWVKRSMDIDSVAKSLPDSHKICDFVMTTLKKRYGVE